MTTTTDFEEILVRLRDLEIKSQGSLQTVVSNPFLPTSSLSKTIEAFVQPKVAEQFSAVEPPVLSSVSSNHQVKTPNLTPPPVLRETILRSTSKTYKGGSVSLVWKRKVSSQNVTGSLKRPAPR